MGTVSTSAAWGARVAFYEACLLGEWTWAPGAPAASGVWLVDPDGLSVGAVLATEVRGIIAALNTFEGRAAYARAMV